MPAYLLLGNTLTTSSFEPLFWTLAIYCTVRMTRTPAAERSRWWLALAVTVAAGAYCKYSIALAAAGIVVGLLATPERRLLRSPWALAALGLALLLLAPNLAWQALQGWPILDVLRGDAAHRQAFQNGLVLEYRNAASNAIPFALEQLLYANPAAAPIWIAGLTAPFRVAALRDLRFVAVTFAFAFFVGLALAAKGYYIAGVYASLFAIGAVAIERAAASLRTVALALLVAVGVGGGRRFRCRCFPSTGSSRIRRRSASRAEAERRRISIQPLFAEEFGWQRLARDVAAIYLSLPSTVRNRTAIYADTYGDAGALDFFGPRYGLPPAISSQNNYYLWGTRGYDGSTMIAIGATRIDRAAPISIAASYSCARRSSRTSGSWKAPRRFISAAIRSRRCRSSGPRSAGTARSGPGDHDLGTVGRPFDQGKYRLCHLFHRCDTSFGIAARHELARLRLAALRLRRDVRNGAEHHVGLRVAGTDGVGRDARSVELGRQRARETHDAVFAGGIGRDVGRTASAPQCSRC